MAGVSKCACFSGTDVNGRIAFLIPFNAATSAKLLANPPGALDMIVATNDTTTNTWVSNDQLTKIDPWMLPATTTKVYEPLGFAIIII